VSDPYDISRVKMGKLHQGGAMLEFAKHVCGCVQVRTVSGKREKRESLRKFFKIVKCELCRTDKKLKTRVAIRHKCGHVENHKHPTKDNTKLWEDQLREQIEDLQGKVCTLCLLKETELEALNLLAELKIILPPLTGTVATIEWARAIQYPTFLFYYREGNSIATILHLFELMPKARDWVLFGRNWVRAELEERLYIELYGPIIRSTWKTKY